MKFSSIVKMTGALAASVMLTGCGWFIGDKVEVPPAHVGKINWTRYCIENGSIQ